VLRFWRNPELVRHVRAELRAARALTAAVIVIVVCALVGLACWSAERHNPRDFFRLFYAWLTGMQYVFLGFWCASACGQGIARERELKTYDFLRTTRLSSGELMVGKLLGAPVLAYFSVGCSVPVSFLAGVLGGYRADVLLGNYVLLVVFALLVSLVGLWGSMLVEKSSAGAIGVFGLIAMTLMFGMVESPFPGLGAISIVIPVLTLHGPHAPFSGAEPTLFGLPASFPVLTLVLYVTLGAWLVLMLTRNLKKDLQQIRLLSRWQAVGLAAYLNLLFYALLDPGDISASLTPKDIASLAMAINAMILFLVGLATLTPYEKLKVWWRRRAAGEESYFSAQGLPWPWLLPAAALAYAFLVAEAAGLHATVPIHQWRLGAAAIQLLVFLVFTTRDILFLQWCNLTHMKRPIVKGFLFLCLYYAAVGIVGLVVDIMYAKLSGYVLGLTPYYVFNSHGVGLRASPGIYVGLVLQVPVVVFILRAIGGRLQRPALVPATSAA